MSTVIHVTHEAVQKVGGIGAVLQGFFTARAYGDNVKRSILVGPIGDPAVEDLLAKSGKILYSSLSGTDEGGWAARFRPIQQAYGVGVVYGTRTFHVAHQHILANFGTLEDGAVVCVEHILGERPEPKPTEMRHWPL